MRVRYGSGVWEWGMGVGYGSGKLKEPGRGESVGFNLLVFIASSALAYTSVGYCPSVPPTDRSQLAVLYLT